MAHNIPARALKEQWQIYFCFIYVNHTALLSAVEVNTVLVQM